MFEPRGRDLMVVGEGRSFEMGVLDWSDVPLLLRWWVERRVGLRRGVVDVVTGICRIVFGQPG